MEPNEKSAGSALKMDQVFEQMRNKPESQVPWTPAVFLDRAEELRRRLGLWHIHDGSAPDCAFPFRNAQESIQWTFRSFIFRHDHGPRPGAGLAFHSGFVSEEERSKGVVGFATEIQPSEIDKNLTLWLLRNFFEHLADAGTTSTASYLRLKVDRILDSLIYCKRPSRPVDQERLDELNTKGGGPYTYVDGRTVDPELLDSLVGAARLLMDDDRSAQAIQFEGNHNALATPTHSDGFRSVNWYGHEYSFTGNQAAVVEMLWGNWQRGTPDVGQETLLETVGGSGKRLRDVFEKGKHQAWGAMIVRGNRKGTFRLAEPKES